MILGNTIDPNSLLEKDRRDQVHALNSSLDQLPLRITQIHEWVHSNVTVPTIYFFHCEAGADRTGEIAGSYVMQYKNLTAKQAYDWDNVIASRNIEEWSKNAILYYCWWLTYELGYSSYLGCDSVTDAVQII